MIGRLPTRNGKAAYCARTSSMPWSCPRRLKPRLVVGLAHGPKRGALVKWAMMRGTGEDEFVLFDQSCSSCATWTS